MIPSQGQKTKYVAFPPCGGLDFAKSEVDNRTTFVMEPNWHYCLPDYCVLHLRLQKLRDMISQQRPMLAMTQAAPQPYHSPLATSCAHYMPIQQEPECLHL